MNRKIAAGALGGLIGGLVLDVLMRALPAAGQTSMIAFAAEIVHASNPLVGWLGYPAYGIVIGALFGWLLQGQTLDDVRAALWGGAYGVAWWIIAELVAIPALLATRPFSAAAIDGARGVALPLLAGHVVYGLILGVAWSEISARLSPPHRPRTMTDAARRAA